MEKKPDALHNLFLKFVSSFSKDSTDLFPTLSTSLELLRVCITPEGEDPEPETNSALPTQEPETEPVKMETEEEHEEKPKMEDEEMASPAAVKQERDEESAVTSNTLSTRRAVMSVQELGWVRSSAL